MKFNILSDAHWESRVDMILNELSKSGFRQFFEARDYGGGLDGVIVVFMCRDPSLNFDRRVRWSKKTRTLYLDIMLDLAKMRSATPSERKFEIVRRIFDEMPPILSKYDIPNFDSKAFIADLQALIGVTE